MAAYPRKETVFIFLICIFAVLGVTYYVHGDYIDSLVYPDQTARENSDVSVTGSDSAPINNDWKKQFLTASTSGNDFRTGTTKTTSKEDENLTSTAILGREFLTKFAELKKSGLAEDSKTVSNVMGQVVSQNINKLPEPKVYILSNISTVSDNPLTLKQYSLTVTNIFQTYTPRENEAVVVERAFDHNDMTELSAIDPIIVGYRAIVNKLLSTPVPTSLSAYHLNLINGFSIALYNAESFRHIDTDPARSFAAIGLELTGLQKISTSITDIQRYLASQGIAF